MGSVPGLGRSPGEGNDYLLRSFNGPEPGGLESSDKKVKERERGLRRKPIVPDTGLALFVEASGALPFC